MRRLARLLVGGLAGGLSWPGAVSQARAATDVTTFGYDLQRTGLNPYETARRQIGGSKPLRPPGELATARFDPVLLPPQLPLAVVIEAQVMERNGPFAPHGGLVDIDQPRRVGGLDDLGRAVGAGGVAGIVEPGPVVRAEMGVAQAS